MISPLLTISKRSKKRCSRLSQNNLLRPKSNISMVYSLSYLIRIPIKLMKCGNILVPFWKSTSYLQKRNPSQIWVLKIQDASYNTTGHTIKRYMQQSGKEFKCRYCYCCLLSQIRDLEPFLRVDVRKEVIELYNTATLKLCWFQIQFRADETRGFWRLHLYF